MFERKLYKTKGGWDAQVIWICKGAYRNGFYAIHKPGTDDETVPIWHQEDGTAHAALSVNEPPYYNGHPADLLSSEEL